MDNNASQFLWVEKYRPNTINDCILPKSIKTALNDIVKCNDIPNLMFSGGPGCGKTTAARALCNEIGSDMVFLNASLNNGIDVLRNDIAGFASTVSFEGGAKVVILDEADNLSAAFQPALRGFIEQFAKNCRFILTVNYPQRLIPAIHSRCKIIDFNIPTTEKKEVMTNFMVRIESILNHENIKFTDRKIIAALTKKYFPDYRRTLGELQTYALSGQIDEGILVNVKEVQIDELVKALKDRDYGQMRKWVAVHIGEQEPAMFIRKIYDSMYDFLKPESIPQTNVILGEYAYRQPFVADVEVWATALLTEILTTCQFKD